MNNDNYATLGILPSAEDVVIKAAYRALAQRYHPDRYEGSVEEAQRRMAAINEAYAVLGDPVKRKAYDESRPTTKDEYSWFADTGDEQNTTSELYDALDADWKVACDYFPDLDLIFSRLSQVARMLAVTYQAFILETKSYQSRREIAENMERLFLEKYFGTNAQVLIFARRLIEFGHKSALKALNNSVRVLGSDINSRIIIEKIAADFGIYNRKSADFAGEDIRLAEAKWLEFRRAICDDRLDTVQNLLAVAPALIVCNTDVGNSALHLAISEGRPAILDALLQAGADPNAYNVFGLTPIDFAKDAKRSDLLNIFAENSYIGLLNRGAK